MGWLYNIYSVDGEKYLKNHKAEKVNFTVIAITFLVSIYFL